MAFLHVVDFFKSAPVLDPPIAFNISHDEAIVVMTSAPSIHGSPTSTLGIDIMKVQIPRRQTLASLIETVEDQLTPLEYHNLLGHSEKETLRRFYWLWTMKEAYTKALGIGLGFDFRRIEYDMDSGVLRVDNATPKGWKFHKFMLTVGGDLYQGVVAEGTGDADTVIIPESQPPSWLTFENASDWCTVFFIQKTYVAQPLKHIFYRGDSLPSQPIIIIHAFSRVNGSTLLAEIK